MTQAAAAISRGADLMSDAADAAEDAGCHEFAHTLRRIAEDSAATAANLAAIADKYRDTDTKD